MTFSSEWKDKTEVNKNYYEEDETYVYSVNLSKDLISDEGMGNLFSIVLLNNDAGNAYRDYPSYEYWGLVRYYDLGTYHVVFTYPTDVQFDDGCSDVYLELSNQIEDVLASFKIKESYGGGAQILSREEQISEGYSEEELCDMARIYYSMKNGQEPPIVEVDSVEGDIVSIHLYEDMGDHTATWDWYSVDRTTGKGSSMMDQIDLTETEGVSLEDVVANSDIPRVNAYSKTLGQKLNLYNNNLGYPMYSSYQEKILLWNNIPGYKYYDASNQTEFIVTDSDTTVVGYGYLFDLMSSDYQMVGAYLETDIDWPEPKTIAVDATRYYIWQENNGYMIIEATAYSSECDRDYKRSYIKSIQFVSDPSLSKLLE